jgi:SpoVK/Ycf46/Vps4 family AAA+-type ATPase|nr:MULTISPECIES: ATP-binding protein [Ensifer]
MDDLAHRVASPATWDDLILAPRQKDVLESIIAQVRNRTQVYEEWGFGVRLQHKGLGVSALFSGPSGAGKSMAGEVIGNALDLDVYRVDLSAMVSKWVGETEKNLRRVFDAAEDGGVILQFDEADALFGRRSEVKDSHDRHANIEVSYLLQRLEAYRGLCILTTNMRDNIDDAFLRRLRFIVDFRFPNLAERRAIWMRIFPDAQPREQLDYDKLAQLNLAGGSIRNIALGAAFLAADRGCAVSMAEILQAAQLEYDKVGRQMTDAERAGWLQ